MKDAIRNWFQANGGGETGTITITTAGQSAPPDAGIPDFGRAPDGGDHYRQTESELHDLKMACGGGTLSDITTTTATGSTAWPGESPIPHYHTIPGQHDGNGSRLGGLAHLLHDWKHNHPGVSGHPEIVFPIQVVMKDDGTVVTVNSKQELHDLKENCD